MNTQISTNAEKYYCNLDSNYRDELEEWVVSTGRADYDTEKYLIPAKLTSISKSGEHGEVFCKLWERFIRLGKAKNDYKYLTSCHDKFLILLSRTGHYKASMLSSIILKIYKEKQLDFESCLAESRVPLLKKLFSA
ncbi:MAG: hypothetical protein JXB49_25390 [Bacteroidales bacterium]|nr:hypothetical protein [Bacteroidales bacterium]